MRGDGSTTGQRTPPEIAKSAPAMQAIAVLPLANMSADPENEYFSDGMTEEIINALAKVPGLQVASRSSCFAFKGKQIDIREVGEKLGVGSVLEGSVRKVGNKLRITAQLINVENGYHLWSETYNRQSRMCSRSRTSYRARSWTRSSFACRATPSSSSSRPRTSRRTTSISKRASSITDSPK